MLHSGIALKNLDSAIAQFEGRTARQKEHAPASSAAFTRVKGVLSPVLERLSGVPLDLVQVTYGTRAPDMSKVDGTLAKHGDATRLVRDFHDYNFGHRTYLTSTPQSVNRIDPAIEVVHNTGALTESLNSLSVIVINDVSYSTTNPCGGPSSIPSGQLGFFLNLDLRQEIYQDIIFTLAKFIALMRSKAHLVMRAGIFGLNNNPKAPFVLSFMEDDEAISVVTGKKVMSLQSNDCVRLAEMMREAYKRLKDVQDPLVNISILFTE